MKKLQCDGCGSSDFIKKDGLFECQYCGLKYSPEEISNLYNKVKIDNSEKVDNLIQLARRAKRDKNWTKCAQYYEMVLIEDSNNWEAFFYTDYLSLFDCSGKKSKHIYSVISNTLDTVLPLIHENISDQAEQENAVLEIAQCIYNLTHKLNIDTDTYDSASSLMYMINILYVTGNKIESEFPDNANYEPLIADLWKSGVKMHLSILDFLSDTKNAKKIILSYSDRIKEYDNDFEYPKFKSNPLDFLNKFRKKLN